jgi:uncharacterized protein
MDDVLTLNEIWIYPIKSLGGISLEQSKVLEKGLEYDRRWMLVDEHGKFMTQRTFPAMALFKLSLVNDAFRVHFKNEWIDLPKLFLPGETVEATIWEDSVTTCEVSREISHWFSQQLNTTCKLVFFPEQNRRLVDGRYQVNQEHVSLADAYPFLIIGQQSLNELNSKLNEAVPMNRFRPNFVFSGAKAHNEDSWREFTIGDNQFIGVKRCGRCAITTVDQDTAITGKEPLRTLATYRNTKGKIYFGQNLVAVNHAVVKVGDKITIQTRQ